MLPQGFHSVTVPLSFVTKESGMRRLIDDLFTKAQIMPNILCQFEDVNSKERFRVSLIAGKGNVLILRVVQKIRNQLRHEIRPHRSLFFVMEYFTGIW